MCSVVFSAKKVGVTGISNDVETKVPDGRRLHFQIFFDSVWCKNFNLPEQSLNYFILFQK